MKKVFTLLFLFCIIMHMLSSCERDEICIDPITPKLSIVFYDVEDVETPKPINDLAIKILDIDGEDVDLDPTSSDSINIPLNIYALQTTIVLTTNSKDPNLINEDTLRIGYEPEDVFVGRSCGYKSVFKNVTIDTNFDDDNKWLRSLTEIQTEILNETTAHVKILH